MEVNTSKQLTRKGRTLPFGLNRRGLRVNSLLTFPNTLAGIPQVGLCLPNRSKEGALGASVLCLRERLGHPLSLTLIIGEQRNYEFKRFDFVLYAGTICLLLPKNVTSIFR